MSVEIDPLELGFRRPFTVEVAQILKIRNPNNSPVAFKVKTTAPKQYCVRPNSGRIEPDQEVEVSVLLQAMKQDPPLDTKCRDKFLVQSVIISGDKEFSSVQEIWDSVEKASIQEKKIRVNFLPAGSGDGTGAAATPIKQPHLSNGIESTPDTVPPAYSSPAEEMRHHTPSSVAGASSVAAPPSIAETATESKFDSDAATTVLTPKTTDDSSTDALKAQLAQAESTIAALKQQEGLRQRKGIAPASEKPSVAEVVTAVRPQGTEGVPIQIVAILCLISFLLAYFFF